MAYDVLDVYDFLDHRIYADEDRAWFRSRLVEQGNVEALLLFDQCTGFRFCPDSELPF